MFRFVFLLACWLALLDAAPVTPKPQNDPCHTQNVMKCNKAYSAASASGDCQKIKNTLPCLRKVHDSCSWQTFNEVFRLSNYDSMQNSMKCLPFGIELYYDDEY